MVPAGAGTRVEVHQRLAHRLARQRERALVATSSASEKRPPQPA